MLSLRIKFNINGQFSYIIEKNLSFEFWCILFLYVVAKGQKQKKRPNSDLFFGASLIAGSCKLTC